MIRPSSSEPDGGGHPAHRVVAAPPAHLGEPGARGRRQHREQRLGGELPRLHRRLQRPEEELARRGPAAPRPGGPPAPPRPAPPAPRASPPPGRRARCCRPWCPGCGWPAWATNRSAFASSGWAAAAAGSASTSRVPRQRPHPDLAVLHPDVAELGQPVDVDEVLRRGEAHGQQRHQRLPAREHLPVLAERREESPAPRPWTRAASTAAAPVSLCDPPHNHILPGCGRPRVGAGQTTWSRGSR